MKTQEAITVALRDWEGEEELVGEPSAVDEATLCLRSFGIEVNIPVGAARAVLVAEAVNFAAKEITEEFYSLKSAVIDEAANWPEVKSGWGSDGAFFMYAEGAGTVSFHDPNGEINSKGNWVTPWSGISRQHLSFECLAGKPVLKRLALVTNPKFSAELTRYQQLVAGIQCPP